MDSGLICLASSMISGSVSVNSLLSDMNFSAFEVPGTDLFDVETDLTLTFFETVYNTASSKGAYYEQFSLRFALDYELETSNGVLQFQMGNFSSESVKVLHSLPCLNQIRIIFCCLERRFMPRVLQGTSRWSTTSRTTAIKPYQLQLI